MTRRFQFSLRAVFLATTMAAVAGVAWHPFVRVLDSFDSLAKLVLLMAIPMLLPPAILLAILPFAYRKAVREIIARQVQDQAEKCNE